MDFKAIISKIESIDGPIETPKAPEQAAPIRLDEGTELRVLAGVTALTESVIAEGKKAKEEKEKEVEEGFDADAKVGDTFKTKTGVATKTKTGVKHEKTYGSDSDDKDEDDDAPKAKKAKKESIDPTEFKSKFDKMVEAKKVEEKKMSKKDKKMDEASKPDFLDLDKDGNKTEPMKKAAADKKKGAVKKESAMMPKGKKRPVKESVEQKLTFKQMVQLVQESGGQQQIDPTDKELFAWAQRVASSKFTESTKAELYAGLVYERMGGVFEMYDVLSEDQK